MNLDNIEKKITAVVAQYHIAVRAQERLDEIKLILEKLFEALEMYQTKMKKEHEDVVRLEKMSKNYLFAVILGNKEEQLERERQEYLQAVLEYNGIANEIQLIKYEQQILQVKVDDIDDLKRQRDYYLKVKEQKILFQNSPNAKAIKAANREIDRLRGQLYKFQEPRSIAVAIQDNLGKARRKLANIERFGISKFYGAGSMSSFQKKQLIDEAIKDITLVNHLLIKLEGELKSIYAEYIFLNIYKYQNFIETFYDHLITDWVVKEKLINASNCIEIAESQIQRIIDTLTNDIINTEGKVSQLVENKRNLSL